MKLISEKKSLRGLAFYDCNLTDEHILALEKLPQMANLYIKGASVTDAIFSHIAEQMPKLSYLFCEYCPHITGRGLSAFQNAKLEHFGTEHSSFSDEGLAEVATLPKLRSIRLDDVNITYDGVMAVAHNPYLEIYTKTMLTDDQQAEFRAKQRELSITNNVTLPQEEIDKAIITFIQFHTAADAWEDFAYLHGKDTEELTERIRTIFNQYCTDQPRAYSRPNSLSYGSPAQYHDTKIVATENVSKSKIHLYCEKGTGTDVDEFRILMVKKSGVWKVDKRWSKQGKWQATYL